MALELDLAIRGGDRGGEQLLSLYEFLRASHVGQRVMKRERQLSEDQLGGTWLLGLLVSVSANAVYDFLRTLVSWFRTAGAARTVLMIRKQVRKGKRTEVVEIEIQATDLLKEETLREIARRLIGTDRSEKC